MSTSTSDTDASDQAIAARGALIIGHDKKTVSVPDHLVLAPDPGTREHTDTLAWREIHSHPTTGQMPAGCAKAYKTSGVDRFGLIPAAFQEDNRHAEQNCRDGDGGAGGAGGPA